MSGNVLEEGLILNGGTVKFGIDALSRTTSIKAPQFSQEILEFDPVGNLIKMQIGPDETEYTYDNLYQLTSESGFFTHNYAYDSLNNRLEKDDESYEINALNQIDSQFEYDLNGNPIKCNETTYTYDALDRLIKVESPDSTETYTYDSFHRRLTKTTPTWFGPETTYFLYDGQNEIGAFDEALKVQELRILGNSPHAEIGSAVAIELNQIPHIPVHDLQGNLASLQPIDSEPTSYHYSAFGEEKISGYAISPWRFSSKRTDSSQLVYFGRRYYIPSFGRWLTPDPAGFTDGMNLYAYVHNAPLTHFDEYGLIMMARDYNTVKQITGTPWESERPWSALSHYGRNLASRATHDLYDQCWAPIQRDFDRCSNLFSHSSQPTEQRIGRERQSIDGFFGTNILNRDALHSQLAQSLGMPEWTIGYIPFPGNALGAAGRTMQVGNRVFANRSTLSPVSKLLNVQRRANPTTIRFTQPTISQNFSKGGDINDMIQGLRSGRIKVSDIPTIRVAEYEGQMFTLDNRRLAAFQNARIKDIPIERVSLSNPNIINEFSRKYKPIIQGKNIVVIPSASARQNAINILREYGKIKHP